jgi:hypothetical protein
MDPNIDIGLAPDLGEHTHSVLTDTLGFSGDEAARFDDAHVTSPKPSSPVPLWKKTYFPKAGGPPPPRPVNAKARQSRL